MRRKQRASRWGLLLFAFYFLLFTFYLRPAGAQAPAPEAAPTPDATTDFGLADAAYREITMMEIIHALQISPSQARDIAKTMENIQDLESQLADARTAAYGQAHTILENYLDAVLSARPVSPDMVAAADRAYQMAAASVQRHEIAIQGQVVQILNGVLDRAQVDGLEFPEERMAKMHEAARLLAGGGVGIDAVMNDISQARQLPAEQYQAQADAVAQRIAARVAGPQSQSLGYVARVVRGFLDEARQYSDANFDANRPVFQVRVAQALGLAPQRTPTPDESGPQEIHPDVVAFESFEAFLRDPRGLDLLHRLLATQGSSEETGSTPPAPPAAGTGGEGAETNGD